MKVTIKRNALLKPIQMISGVVEKRTMPILANVLIQANAEGLTLTGTDLEIELKGYAKADEVSEPGTITVSAHKLLNICKALPEDALLTLTLEGDQVILKSGRSRFLLATLPVEDFPNIEESSFNVEFSISPGKLKKIMSKVHFAMGQQDVRHYLNGALFDLNQGTMKCVATDGHRLAFSSIEEENLNSLPSVKIILPRKSVIELMRLMDANSEDLMTLCIGENHFRVKGSDFVFTSKLVNAAYPDYEKLIPKQIALTATAQREALKQALARAAILSNEKFRGVRLQLEDGALRIVANNPEQEEAEETIHLEYAGQQVEIGFNINYLMDVVNAISTEKISLHFNDPNGGFRIEPHDGSDPSCYVVMPMRLW